MKRDYTPQNDENTLYIPSGYNLNLSELLEMATDHFPGVELSDLTIESEKIHTRCITYDLYDSGDWDDYIIIRRT